MARQAKTHFLCRIDTTILQIQFQLKPQNEGEVEWSEIDHDISLNSLTGAAYKIPSKFLIVPYDLHTK